MFFRALGCLLLLLIGAHHLNAQTENSTRYQLFGGYSFLPNSMNGVSGSHQPLNGYEVAFAIPPWHNLRFKLNAFQYRGSNLGAIEHPYFIMAGGQYGWKWGEEAAFVEALAGEGNVNSNWGAGKSVGDTASFSAILGGGIDTPLSPHFSFRVQGDFQYAYFKQNASWISPAPAPTYVAGLPNYFGRLASGLVWRF